MRRTPTLRKRRERGHVALEMALGFLPLMAMIFAIMDFSMVVFIQGAFQNATEEAVRFGITYNLTYNGTTYSTQTAAMTAVVEANSFGFLNATNAATYIAVNYYLPNNLSTPATTASLNLPTGVVVNGVTITNLNQTGNVMQVVVSGYPWSWMVPLQSYCNSNGVCSAGMPGKFLTIGATSLDVLQGLPVGVFTYPSP
jgi:Flp pilus assembly protein TadG